MNYYSQLLPYMDYIISELELSFLVQHRCSKESDLYLNFHDLLIDRVEKFMRIYTIPENTDEHFKLVRGFITQFRKTIYYEGTVKNSYTKTNRENRNINIVTDEERKLYKGGITNDRLISEINTEEQVIQLDLQKRVQKGFNQFTSYLNPFERVFFKGMYEGRNLSSIIRKISDEGFEPPTYDVSQRIRNLLEFRLTCFFAQEKEILYDKRIVLKSLNKFPKLNSKIFGIRKLDEIPTQDQLENAIRKENFYLGSNSQSLLEKKQIVYQYDPESRIQLYGKKYFAKSKTDFNGKKHDHFVVYIDHSLNGYCHVTKQSRKLA